MRERQSSNYPTYNIDLRELVVQREIGSELSLLHVQALLTRHMYVTMGGNIKRQDVNGGGMGWVTQIHILVNVEGYSREGSNKTESSGGTALDAVVKRTELHCKSPCTP